MTDFTTNNEQVKPKNQSFTIDTSLVIDRLSAKERKRATDAEKEDRKDRIVGLFAEYGEERLTNAVLAKELSVSISTIERDIKEIKEDSFIWVERLAKENYVYECRMTFKRLQALVRSLNQRFKREEQSMSTEDLTKLAQMIAKLEESKMQIIQQPTLYALRLAMQKANRFEELLPSE